MDTNECKEEQEGELEALESIYEDDFKLVSPSQFELIIKPNTTATNDENHVILCLNVQYPPMYPEEEPIILLSSMKGLVKRQLNELKQIADDEIKECKGEVCVFSVAELLKEWLIEHNVEEKSLHQKIEQSKLQVKQQNVVTNTSDEFQLNEEKKSVFIEEPKVYSGLVPAGTLTTLESFADWKVKFDAELKAKQPKIEESDEIKKRLTGKQYFQNKLLKMKEEQNVEQPTEVFWFNEGVYDDDDLPCDDDSDD